MSRGKATKRLSNIAAEVGEQDTNQIVVIGVAAFFPNNVLTDCVMDGMLVKRPLVIRDKEWKRKLLRV